MIMKMLSAHKSSMIFNGENELKRPRVGWRKPDPGDWQKLKLYNKPDRWSKHINYKQPLMKGAKDFYTSLSANVLRLLYQLED